MLTFEEKVAEYLSYRSSPDSYLRWLAKSARVPSCVLIAIYRIEGEFRPGWFRLIEWCLVYIVLIPLVVIGFSFPNLTVGRFQVSVSVLCEGIGIPAVVRGGCVRIPRSYSSQLVAVLTNCEQLNRLSAVHIGTLWSGTHGQFASRVAQVGQAYNGSRDYGVVLSMLAAKLCLMGERTICL